MEKISRKGFLKIAAAAAMSSVTAAGLAACNAASSSTAAASSGAAGIYIREFRQPSAELVDEFLRSYQQDRHRRA